MKAAAALARRLAGASRAFRARLGEARAVQARGLAAILRRHAACEYGRRFDFAGIASYDDYRRRVPVVDAQALGPAVERMARGERDVLLGEPVVAFEETGGSAAGPKLVPYGEAALDAFRRALLPWLDDVYASHPGLAEGSTYWSISPAARPPGRTAGGIPIGLGGDAAYLGPELAAELAATLAVPPAAAAITDMAEWRRFTATHLLADESLALVSVWSPTFLIELLRYMKEHARELAGGIADRRRAARVLEILEADPPRFDALWPRLGLISCWDQAAARPYAVELRRLFPAAAVQGKGLLATEGVVTIPLAGCAMPVLAIESGFYEFIDEAGVACAAQDVREGGDYQVLVTNHSGLYRYAIGDRVRVHGFQGEAPMLEFIGRERVSDLCGEKISEAFALAVLGGFGLRFAALAAEAQPARRYVLIVDAAEVAAEQAGPLAARVEQALGADPQYAYARALEQLRPLVPLRCERPLQRWLDAGLRRGQRLGDIKPCGLVTGAGWRELFGETR